MGGAFRSHPKIAGRMHQGFAKMIHPYSIHKNAGGQRIVRTDNRFGQFQSTAAVLEGLAFSPGQKPYKSNGNLLTPVTGLAPDKDMRFLNAAVVPQVL